MGTPPSLSDAEVYGRALEEVHLGRGGNKGARRALSDVVAAGANASHAVKQHGIEERRRAPGVEASKRAAHPLLQVSNCNDNKDQRESV